VPNDRELTRVWAQDQSQLSGIWREDKFRLFNQLKGHLASDEMKGEL